LYLGDLVPSLLSNLESKVIDAEVKVQSIGSLADLASNSRGAFVTYIPSVLTFIQSAAQASSQIVDEAQDQDLSEYMVRLREVIIQFYVSCLQGLHEAKQADIILAQFQYMLEYSLLVTQDNYSPSHDINLSVCGLIGDAAVAFGSKASPLLKSPPVREFLTKHSSNPSQRVREVAVWAIKAVQGL
jgi:hypothetical protein